MCVSNGFDKPKMLRTLVIKSRENLLNVNCDLISVDQLQGAQRGGDLREVDQIGHSD